jgi:hypothetical protein
MTDARHGNSNLKNEQQVFTTGYGREKAEEKAEKCWNGMAIRSICEVKRSERNEPLTTTTHIQKNGRLSDVDDAAFVSV